MHECPKFEHCNSAFCPAEMSGSHLRDESICKYFRLYAKNKLDDIPVIIFDAITENQSEYLKKGFRGYMSQYKKLLKQHQ